MATENNSLTNVFHKGMDTDTSYQMLDEGEYVLAKNVRIMSLNGTGSSELSNAQGEVRPIEGVVVDPYVKLNYDVKKILATNSCRDYGIIIFTTEDDEWHVARFTNKKSVDDRFHNISDFEVILNSHKTTEKDHFSTTMSYEDQDVLNLYIATGEDPVLTLNIINPPEDSKNVLDKLRAYPEVYYTPPRFEGLITGSLKAGLVQYSYRLYNKFGVSTDISPATKLIPIVKESVPEGFHKEDNTNIGVEISIPRDSRNDYLTKIQIFRITYFETGLLPSIEMVEDCNISNLRVGDLYKFRDLNSVVLSTLTLEEYNSMSGIHIIPQVIENKNDYLFAANIKSLASWTIGEDGIDKLNDTKITYKFVRIDLIGDASKKAKYIGAVQYNTKTFGSKFYRKASNSDFDFNCKILENTADGWKEGEKSGSLPDGIDQVYTYGTFTYADAQASYYLKSLRRGETYRYGIVFYNKYGEASHVKHIGDIQVPYLNDLSGLFNTFEFGETRELIVHPLGLEFTVENAPEGAVAYEIVRCNRTDSDIKTISQGVIARPIKRDNATYNTVFPYTPTGFLTCTSFFAESFGQHDDFTTEDMGDQGSTFANNYRDWNLFQFVSPEISYLDETIKTELIGKNLLLRPIRYIYPKNYNNFERSWLRSWYGLVDVGVKNSSVYYVDKDGGYINKKNGSLFVRHGLFYVDKIGSGTIPEASSYDMFYGGLGSPESPHNYYYPSLSPVSSQYARATTYANIAKYNQYGYAKLYFALDRQFELGPFEVDEIVIPETLYWDDVVGEKGTEESSDYAHKYKNFEVAVGSETYNNIVMYGHYGATFSKILKKDKYSDDLNRVSNSDELDNNFISLGGKCAVVSLKGMTPNNALCQTYDDVRLQAVGTFLCNIEQKVTPYGGTSDSAIKLSQYYSYGNYSTIDKNTITVFDGDCYIMPFEYVSAHKYYTEYDVDTGLSFSMIYSIPVETNINLAYTTGEEFSKNYLTSGITSLQTKAGIVYDQFTQQKPLYEYNTAYSSNATARVFTGQLDEDDENDLLNCDYRVYYSGPKLNKEYINSWTKFLSANYLDVDSKYGPITHLRTFHNQLFFWQLEATGILSTNERTVISQENNLPLILGTGDVLSRYDYLDDTSGMVENLGCDTKSDTTLYWWDDDNLEIKAYRQGNSVAQLSKLGRVQNIMHHLSASSYNSPKATKKPTMFFDKKYNELVANVLKDHQIAYNEQIQAFTSLYTLHYADAVVFLNKTYLVNANKDHLLGQWNMIEDVPRDFPNEDGDILKTYISYVVNKMPTVTKVFDNQEIVTVNKPFGKGIEFPGRIPYFKQHHNYTWDTDINGSKSSDLDMTYREGNYRYAVPRESEAKYGDRIRGKYMICSIEDTNPDYDASISYIITKFRASWS